MRVTGCATTVHSVLSCCLGHETRALQVLYITKPTLGSSCRIDHVNGLASCSLSSTLCSKHSEQRIVDTVNVRYYKHQVPSLCPQHHTCTIDRSKTKNIKSNRPKAEERSCLEKKGYYVDLEPVAP